MKKKKTYKRRKYGKGIKVTRPYINKRNRLMLGEGKIKSIKRQKGGFIGPLAAAFAPVAANLISKIIR